MTQKGSSEKTETTKRGRNFYRRATPVCTITSDSMMKNMPELHEDF